MTQNDTWNRRNRPARSRIAPPSFETLESRTLLAGDGLRGEYFNNTDFTQQALVRTDASINFFWNMGSPDSRVQPDTFSVRWTGQIEAPTAGNYTFFVTSDDGARLWIDDKSVVNHWVAHPTTVNQGTIALSAGRHKIRMEYFENTYNATVRLEWAGPGIARQVISKNNLYSQAGTTTTPSATTPSSNTVQAAPPTANAPAASYNKAPAGSIVVSPGQSITQAIGRASAGQTIYILNGTYNESISVNKSVTLQAQSVGGVVINAGGRSFGLNGEYTSNVTVRGLKIINANNATGMSFGALRIGGNWLVEDVTVERSAGTGITIRGNNSRLNRVSSNHNGQLGFGGFGSGSYLQDCNAIGNNTRKNNAAYEAGGVKFYLTSNVTVNGGTWANNGGPAIWFDWQNKNYAVRNAHIYGNHGWHQGWAGVGIASEINDQPGVFENNNIHDNSGAGIAIWEAMNVTIRNNRITNDTIDFRSNPRGYWMAKNIRVQGNTVVNGAITSVSWNVPRSQWGWRGIVVTGNNGVS